MTKRPILETVPIAPLKIIALDSCISLGLQINDIIVKTRKKQAFSCTSKLSSLGYEKDSYLVDYDCPRFGSGESKAIIKNPIRGTDLFILADVINPTISYTAHQTITYKSPDDHFQDLKRIIAACNGQTHRINVILPFLYESRQHRRTKLESLDCAIALQELAAMGISNIITFDAHDPRVQNAIPLHGFDNFSTSFQFIQALIQSEPNIQIDGEHLLIISPDEGGLTRSGYYADVLGINMGMFYKRRDYTRIVNGKNPIIAHEYLGTTVEGKDVFIIDDMISSGESMLDVAKELKYRKAKRVFIAATFGIFTEGLSSFDEYYKNGLIDRIFTTNLTYTSKELLQKPYYTCVDMSKYLALIIDTLNNDTSVNEILDPYEKIHELIKEHQNIQYLNL